MIEIKLDKRVLTTKRDIEKLFGVEIDENGVFDFEKALLKAENENWGKWKNAIKNWKEKGHISEFYENVTN